MWFEDVGIVAQPEGQRLLHLYWEFPECDFPDWLELAAENDIRPPLGLIRPANDITTHAKYLHRLMVFEATTWRDGGRPIRVLATVAQMREALAQLGLANTRTNRIAALSLLGEEAGLFERFCREVR